MQLSALLIALLFSCAGPAGGEDNQTPEPAAQTWRRPLANQNQFPLSLLFLSLEPSGTHVWERGESAVTLDFSYSNTIAIREGAEEALVVDLELLRSVVRWELGLGGKFQMDVGLPLYALHGGFLDGVISGFHEAFDLPNSVRRREPNGLFRYGYRRNGVVLLEREEAGAAVGDVTLGLRRLLADSPRGELVARAAVKLPTGSREQASGSGATDFGFGVVAGRRGKRVGGYLNASYHILGGDSSAPASLRPRNYFALSGAADFPFRHRLAVVAQLDYVSPLLRSELPTLAEGALQLALGLRYHRSERFTFEWRFTEDLSKASPDITFGFRVEIRPGSGKKKSEAAESDGKKR